jgi:hypothetical protein
MAPTTSCPALAANRAAILSSPKRTETKPTSNGPSRPCSSLDPTAGQSCSITECGDGQIREAQGSWHVSSGSNRTYGTPFCAGRRVGIGHCPRDQVPDFTNKGAPSDGRESVPGTSRHWPPPPRSASTIRPFPGPARARRRPPKWLFASSRLLEMRVALFVCADASALSLHRQSMPLCVCNTPRTTSRAASEAQCNVSILRRAQ